MFRYIYLKGKTLLLLLVLFGLVMTGGCSLDHGGTEVGNPESSSPYGIPDNMTTFSSVEALAAYLKEQYAGNVDAYTGYGYMDVIEVAMPDLALAEGGMAADNYTQTNVQEEGVDESDKVKTDGEYLYIAGRNSVSVIQVTPADDMQISSPINVRGTVDSLYLTNDLLIILYTPESGDGQYVTYDFIGPAEALMPYYIPVRARTGVMILDVSDPTHPTTIKELRADGRLVSSRLTGGRLHVVQQFYPNLPPLQFAYDANDETIDTVIAANRGALAPLTGDDLLPFYDIIDENGNVLERDLLVAPDSFYIPNIPCGGSMTAILTFDIEAPSVPYQSVGIVADAHTIYASTRSLYMTASQYTGNAQVDNDITYNFQTVIHKFNLGEDDVSWAGSGGVKGRILNQFSLGEYQDILRIATTTGASWSTSNPSMNHVFCLETVGRKLATIGRLENLAPGESIYSARFTGTRGFLVTYVQVDPLFTLDISDPTAPRVVGELKVPGYSDYIHPFGEHYLMTIGKDVLLEDGTPWYQGVQLSIFDISDFADPKLLHREIIGDRGTGSEALYNHKAFTYWEQQGLLAIPIDLAIHQTEPTDPWQWGTSVFSGLYVYRATAENGFEFIGRIQRFDDAYPAYYSYWLRGIFIGDYVIAVEEDAVHSAETDDIDHTIRTFPLELLE